MIDLVIYVQLKIISLCQLMPTCVTGFICHGKSREIKVKNFLDALFYFVSYRYLLLNCQEV